MSATVVLVHGAWHGAWCFDRVVPLLAAAGIEAVALDLPGHGASAEPFGDLHGDAAHVHRILDDLGATDVVLLGHSYGGAVITEAGVHPAVRHLVYLCAFSIDEHESCATAGSGDPEAAAISHVGRPNLAHAFAVSEDGTTITLSTAGATECLYDDCDAESVGWALSHIGGQPIASLGQSPSAVAWRTTPSTYIVTTGDQGVHPDLQRILARRCTQSVEWPTGHSPFLNRPELVADLLIDLAAHSAHSVG